MLLEKSRQCPFQLTGAIAMDEPDHALIGHERFVEESLRPGQRFVDGAANDIEIERRRRCIAAAIQLDVHLCAGWRGRRGCYHPEFSDARPHSLAADV